jgi:hypothetical protein
VNSGFPANPLENPLFSCQIFGHRPRTFFSTDPPGTAAAAGPAVRSSPPLIDNSVAHRILQAGSMAAGRWAAAAAPAAGGQRLRPPSGCAAPPARCPAPPARARFLPRFGRRIQHHVVARARQQHDGALERIERIAGLPVERHDGRRRFSNFIGMMRRIGKARQPRRMPRAGPHADLLRRRLAVDNSALPSRPERLRSSLLPKSAAR